LFEPYFSTRPRGTGHGLGLFGSRRSVHAHGGALRVHSAPGAGSTFEVWLPAADAGGERPEPGRPSAVTRS
jgi:signal transduction histidine kinase